MVVSEQQLIRTGCNCPIHQQSVAPPLEISRSPCGIAASLGPVHPASGRGPVDCNCRRQFGTICVGNGLAATPRSRSRSKAGWSWPRGRGPCTRWVLESGNVAMKCNPWRWLWGLAPLLGLGGLMHIGGTFAAIEADLKRQTEAALNAGGQAWAKVAFSGRDATLIGEAVDNSDRLRAAGITRSVLGVRVLDDQSRLLEEEKNYAGARSCRTMAGCACPGSCRARRPGRRSSAPPRRSFRAGISTIA